MIMEGTPLIASVGGDRKRYTRKDDEKIVKLIGEGVSVANVAEQIGRSEASVQYRIYRVLKQHTSFDTINYK